MTRFDHPLQGFLALCPLWLCGESSPPGIARLGGLPKRIQPRHHVAFRHAVAYVNADLLVRRRCRIFEQRAQLLVELLAGAHAGEFMGRPNRAAGLFCIRSMLPSIGAHFAFFGWGNFVIK